MKIEVMLIVGLGNPEKKYVFNRHNVGFLLLDEIQKEFGFPKFELEKKFNAQITRQTFSRNKEIILAKPASFMNNSGTPVKKIADFFKIAPKDIVIIHDDLDIEIGRYKISDDSSAAGHNGVQDIMDELGTQNFRRIRIGVETEGGRQNRNLSGEAYVLRDFTEEEKKKIQNIKASVANEIRNFL